MPLPPPPVVAAMRPAQGAQATSGAAPVEGPGTGAGGVGDGYGSGRYGDGRGGGGGTSTRWVSRPLNRGDLPGGLARMLLAGDRTYVVRMRFTVTAKGRVADCRITRPSGSDALDAATCAAMEAKTRFLPERDAAGRPIPTEAGGEQEWIGRYSPDADTGPDD